MVLKSLRVDKGSSASIFDSLPGGDREVLDETSFRRMIAIERKRSERSKEPFLLMLVNSGSDSQSKTGREVLEKLLEVLLRSSRETDVVGWYKQDGTVGVMFTGLLLTDKNLILSTILQRVSSMLQGELTFEQFSQVSLSFHFFPDDWDHSNPSDPSNSALYPDLRHPGRRKRGLLLVKRSIDLCGSAAALLLMAPLFVTIAAAIKLTCKGPVLFKQQRVGQYGRLFTVYKFRSMVVNNDEKQHREYVTRLIADTAELRMDGKGSGVYKLTNDRRITAVGTFLRRTSLDELPQILNVLRGDMSLVGPRPAIPYELAAYQTWHRRRILEAKPGITGLWQVTGRSLVKFDDMVRLDLRYANSWSLWLDFLILLRTPLVVFKGVGAY